MPHDQKEIKLIDFERNITWNCKIVKAKRNSNEKYLTHGWYDFVKNSDLAVDDELTFEIHIPPNSISVSITKNVEGADKSQRKKAKGNGKKKQG